MRKIVFVPLIGLLMVIGLVFAGCDLAGCTGSGECTVTIKQDAYGLSVDSSFPRSTCGESATYSYETGSYSGGCNVQNNIDDRKRTYGTHSCDCGDGLF